MSSSISAGWLGVLVGILTLFSGIPAHAQATVEEPLRHTIAFGGIEREYFVRLPMEYAAERNYWLLISVHGGGGNGRSNFLTTGIRHAADKANLNTIVVSPSFSNDDFQASRFPALGEGAFLESVVDDLRRQYQLHPKILLTGYSRGGQFTHRFALGHPELVKAVAPFAAGTWTTPQGELLIEGMGRINDPKSFLSDAQNAASAPKRLKSIFTPRVADVAGTPAHPDAHSVPFLVMCGSLDPRFEIAQRFAERMKADGFTIQTEWPRTPHGSRDKEEFKAEFQKYTQRAAEFFVRVTKDESLN